MTMFGNIDTSVFCVTCNKHVAPRSEVKLTNSHLDVVNLRDAISNHGIEIHGRATKVHLEIRITVESGEES